MREIKFRAWATYRESRNQKPAMVYLNPEDGFNSRDLISEEKWQVMQYTGLLDKNGKEIYEGDILKSAYGSVAELKYYKNGFYIDDGIWSNWDAEGIEVIGNIYENPELIKQ